jgi:hypothetical protein
MPVRAGKKRANRQYETLTFASSQFRERAVALRDDMIAGPVSAERIVSLWEFCTDYLGIIADARATPGIVDEAKSQEEDPAYDASAEWLSHIPLIEVLRMFINTAVPKNGGWDLLQTMEADGTRTWRILSSAATVPLQDQLLLVINDITITS